jgi:hypothetical protein
MVEFLSVSLESGTFCMPNRFSIKDGILHYNAQGEEEQEQDPKAAMPDDVEEEDTHLNPRCSPRTSKKEEDRT